MPFSRSPAGIHRRVPVAQVGSWPVRSTSGLVAGCKACFDHSKHLTGRRQRHERSIPARALPMLLPPDGTAEDRLAQSVPGAVLPRRPVLAYRSAYAGLAASFWVPGSLAAFTVAVWLKQDMA